MLRLKPRAGEWGTPGPDSVQAVLYTSTVAQRGGGGEVAVRVKMQASTFDNKMR